MSNMILLSPFLSFLIIDIKSYHTMRPILNVLQWYPHQPTATFEDEHRREFLACPQS